ncbi:hypothetical protein IV203_033742 [Nitzschia inconspicua]|uniref:Uncharacterized protein n=1 Tax=Nitzschia inconspicua TaxID=303405 RepID=A0A9K3Q6Q1_9STRA|nr:hypothetical protein IV203_033742 [Nitzschia inconspicua]
MSREDERSFLRESIPCVDDSPIGLRLWYHQVVRHTDSHGYYIHPFWCFWKHPRGGDHGFTCGSLADDDLPQHMSLPTLGHSPTIYTFLTKCVFPPTSTIPSRISLSHGDGYTALRNIIFVVHPVFHPNPAILVKNYPTHHECFTHAYFRAFEEDLQLQVLMQDIDSSLDKPHEIDIFISNHRYSKFSQFPSTLSNLGKTTLTNPTRLFNGATIKTHSVLPANWYPHPSLLHSYFCPVLQTSSQDTETIPDPPDGSLLHDNLAVRAQIDTGADAIPHGVGYMHIPTDTLRPGYLSVRTFYHPNIRATFINERDLLCASGLRRRDYGPHLFSKDPDAGLHPSPYTCRCLPPIQALYLHDPDFATSCARATIVNIFAHQESQYTQLQCDLEHMSKDFCMIPFHDYIHPNTPVHSNKAATEGMLWHQRLDHPSDHSLYNCPQMH